MNNSLSEKFQKYFSVSFVYETQLKDLIYQLRYRVYCEEFGYEPLENFPDKKESDEFDPYALHCLIIHKESGYPASCVRIVPAMKGGISRPLPLETHCHSSLDSAFIEQLNLSRDTVCEISRLAVDGAFRRRHDEHQDRFGNSSGLIFDEQERRIFPMIAVSAFLATTSLTVLTGKTNVFAMMEPFLPKLLKRSGIFFEPAGKPVDYHGVRAPYFITTESALSTMKPELKALYKTIHSSISAEYEKQIQYEATAPDISGGQYWDGNTV